MQAPPWSATGRNHRRQCYLLHPFQSPYVSNLSTSKNKCFGLILSTEKDRTVHCTCFIVNKYFEISVYPSLLHTLQGASLCKIVLPYGEYPHYLPTKAAQVPNRNMKQKTKTSDGITEKGRPMLQGHRVPGPCSQNKMVFSSRPSASLPS